MLLSTPGAAVACSRPVHQRSLEASRRLDALERALIEELNNGEALLPPQVPRSTHNQPTTHNPPTHTHPPTHHSPGYILHTPPTLTSPLDSPRTTHTHPSLTHTPPHTHTSYPRSHTHSPRSHTLPHTHPHPSRLTHTPSLSHTLSRSHTPPVLSLSRHTPHTHTHLSLSLSLSLSPRAGCLPSRTHDRPHLCHVYRAVCVAKLAKLYRAVCRRRAQQGWRRIIHTGGDAAHTQTTTW